MMKDRVIVSGSRVTLVFFKHGISGFPSLSWTMNIQETMELVEELIHAVDLAEDNRRHSPVEEPRTISFGVKK
jgi:hypothetical protein